MKHDSKNLSESFWKNTNTYFDSDALSKKYMNKPKEYMSKKGYLCQSLETDKNEKAFFNPVPLKTEEKLPISKEIQDIFNWSGDREASFQEVRATVKKQHVKEINASNCYELAYLPMVQEIHQNFKKVKRRDIKLQKFAEGDALNAEDLKFIVDRSDLLNSCVDKEFLQDAINVIDDEVITNLELYLAENIIMNYEEIKSVIKESRVRYFENKNLSFTIQEEKDEMEKRRKAEILQNRNKSQKTIKMYRSICGNLNVKESEGRKKIVKSNKIKKKMVTENSKESKRRNLHPPSKLMSTSLYEKDDIYDKEKSTIFFNH